MQKETMDKYYFHCNKLVKDGLTLEELNNYNNFKNEFTEKEFKLILNEKQRRKNKRYRTKSKFKEILLIKNFVTNAKLIFGTITLDDRHLNLKENTYIRKIHSWLKKHCIYSILNKDYGSKTEREHYHFIAITTDEIEKINKKSKKGYEIYEFKNKTYDMGFEPTLCIINLEENDIDKTIGYLLKLNNHSSKIDAKSRIRVLKNNHYYFITSLIGLDSKKPFKRAKNTF